MHIYIYMHIYICIYMHIYAYICIYLHMCYGYNPINEYTCVYMHIFAWIYSCIWVNMRVSRLEARASSLELGVSRRSSLEPRGSSLEPRGSRLEARSSRLEAHLVQLGSWALDRWPNWSKILFFASVLACRCPKTQGFRTVCTSTKSAKNPNKKRPGAQTSQNC